MSCDVELYFYDELSAADRTAFEEHLAGCAACRAALAELRAIRAALEPLRGEGERSPFEWRSFMRRLDQRLDAEGGARRRGPAVFAVAALAASLVIGIGIAAGLRWQRERTRAVPVIDDPRGSASSAAPDSAYSASSAASGPSASSAASGSSAYSAAAEHFERAKIVLLGLANKDVATTASNDWSYERSLAASLLPDTRLHRLAAIDAGEAELANLLNDLEVLLLQASFASDPDRATLMRLQRYINRRDLFVRMEIGL